MSPSSKIVAVDPARRGSRQRLLFHSCASVPFVSRRFPKDFIAPAPALLLAGERVVRHSIPLNPVNFGAYLKSSVFLASAFVSSAATPIDYTTQIKPLLAEYCYKCHGGSQQKGGLRLDTAASASKGGERGPGYLAGKSSESLVVQAIRGTHPDLPRMPYKKSALTDSQIELIAHWIDEGAPAPAREQPEVATHWAFVPPGHPEAPALQDESRVRSPIDPFVQAQLEAKRISPSPDADRPTLLRRLSLDLIGLPPTPEEIDAFVSDRRSDAYERQVERLLGSPHYGERWGRWWLDAARYADSNGYSIDAPRQIWKYRDWVVAALNRDESFNQFVIEQLAGDLLPNATLEQRIATGFNRNTQINMEGGIDPEQFRVESVMDRVSTFGTVFLGLTVGCAQCHDHKFDPITQREYYQLFAFFNTTEEDGHGKSAPAGMLEMPGEFEPLDEKDLTEANAELDRFLNGKVTEVLAWEKALSAEEREKFSSENLAIFKVPWSDRTVQQKRLSYRAFKADDPEFKTRDARISKLEKRQPRPVTTLVMHELPQPRDSFIFIKGDFTRPSQKVKPGVPAVLHKMPPEGMLEPPETDDRPLNRLDLARWVVDPANPLLGRVIVNRVWQQYFGRGLVETENDFGTQGSVPSNPELLDWLATEFMNPTAPGAQAWSLKDLHRLIVSSTTYRQSSRTRPDLITVDPTNRLLARQSRLRLDAELIRDSALVVSGLLAPELGGPPVFPPQPDGVMSLGQLQREWRPSQGGARYRRALYTHFWRATPHPALSVFDAADGFSTCTRRLRSNTPLQALTLLNDKQFYEFAEALAQRIEKRSGNEPEKIDYAFRLCFGRAASGSEKQRLTQLLKSETTDRWLTFARVILNLDEAITRE
jgi:hypothetical protein